MNKFHELFDRALATTPDKIFIYGPAENITYSDLNNSVEVIQNKLQSMNMPAGQRIMVVGENSKEFIASVIAISRVGGVSCAANSRLTQFEITNYVTRFKPRAIIFTSEKHVAAFDAKPFESMFVTELDNTAEPIPDAAVVMFSSGTSGDPKGVVATHLGILNGAEDSVESRGFRADDKIYAHIPLTHAFGLASVFCAALKSGSAIIMRNTFDPADVFDSLANQGATVLQGPPTMFVKLLNWLDKNNIEHPKCPDLRYLYSGSSPLNINLKNQIERRFQTVLHNGYGCSEHTGAMFVTKLGTARQDDSVGFPVSRLKYSVSTDPEHPSEILIQSPNIMAQYLDDPEQTSSTVKDGWFHTGDIGYVNEEGALFIVGRKKEVIKHSGFSVYPVEIENAINSFDGVEQALVVGKKTTASDEQIIAFIKPANNKKINFLELDSYLRKRLATYKIPSDYREVSDFPIAASGKIVKRELPV